MRMTQYAAPILVLLCGIPAALAAPVEFEKSEAVAEPRRDPGSGLCGSVTRFQAMTPADVSVHVNGIGSLSAPLQIVLVLTLLSFLPAMLVVMTCFTRIIIVFHFLRQALGTQEMPPNQVLVGLSLFLTMFIMAPVGERINERALQPAMAGKLSVGEALVQATPPLR